MSDERTIKERFDPYQAWDKTREDELGCYTFGISCPTCGEWEMHEIVKGMTVKEYRNYCRCHNCGCRLDGSRR